MSNAVKINQELQTYLPKLSEEEYNTLTESILKDGVRDPIVTWKETTDIIDGYNRYNICTEHNIGFNIKALSFASIEDVKEWMLQNQLGRRNLTVEKQKYFIGELYSLRKNKNGGNRGNQYTKVPVGKVYQVPNEMQIEEDYEVEEETTSERLAKEYSISEKTVRNNESFKEAIDKLEEHKPGIKDKILNGDVKLTQEAVTKVLTADDQLVNNIANLTQKDVNRAIKEIEKEENETDEDIVDVNETFQKYVLSKMLSLNVDLKQLVDAWDLINPDLKNEFKQTVLSFKNILKSLDDKEQSEKVTLLE